MPRRNRNAGQRIAPPDLALTQAYTVAALPYFKPCYTLGPSLDWSGPFAWHGNERRE